MMMLPIAAHICFIAGYIFYARQFLLNCGMLIYPVYLAPVVIYLLLAISTAGINHFTREGFFKVFGKVSIVLFVFLMLFSATLLLKFNFPDPHNFTQRKFELLLGCSYAVFLALISGYTIFKINKAINIEEFTLKKIFTGIFIFFFSFYFALALWFNYANQPTGDEPSYLLVAHSIVHDRDIDLKNNYENRDYKAFYNKELQPQGADIIRGGKIYSYHPVLFSIMIAPFYFLAGRLGTTTFINICTSLLISIIFYLLYMIFQDKKTALITSAITGFSMPVLGFSNSIATDVISGLILVSAYTIIKYHRNRTIFLSLLMASVIWMQPRAVPVFAGMALLYLFYNRKKLKSAALFCTIQILSAAGFFIFNYLHYNALMPSYSSQSANEPALFSHNIFTGAISYLLDRQLGLFAYAPVFIFIFAGFYFMLKKNRVELIEMALFAMPYFIVICTVAKLSSGSSSPRYLVPIIFIFSMMLAAAIKEIKTKVSAQACLILSLYGFFLSEIICMIPWFRWDKPSKENPILTTFSRYSHADLTAIFPSFLLPGKNIVIITAFWVLIIVFANIMFIILNKTEK